MFCVYIFGCVTFKILGKGTFTLVQCLFLHLKVLLFVTIFIHKQYSHFHYYIISVLYYHAIMILLHYITKLHYRRLCLLRHDYLFTILVVSIFIFALSLLLPVEFQLTLRILVAFSVLSVLFCCRIYYFLPRDLLSQKCNAEPNSFIFSFSTYI